MQSSPPSAGTQHASQSSRGGLPGQPLVALAIRPGGPAHGRTRTPFRFALSVFRVADMIGIVGQRRRSASPLSNDGDGSCCGDGSCWLMAVQMLANRWTCKPPQREKRSWRTTTTLPGRLDSCRGMVAGCRPGQEQTGPSKGGGLMRVLGGDSTGEAAGSVAAYRVRNALREAACPAEEAPSWPGGTGRMAGDGWLSELLQ